VAARFKWHAESAAARLRFAGSAEDAVSFWLDKIKLAAPESHIRRRLIDIDGSDQLFSVEILDICGLSADYCRKCEADETRARSRAQAHPPDVNLLRILNESVPKGRLARYEIEKFAKNAFATARDRIHKEYADKEQHVLGQVQLSRNSGGYLPALVKLKADNVREAILALADAYVEAFTLYKVPSDKQAEKAVETSAQQIAAGSISTVRGQLELRSTRLRKRQEGLGSPWHREIEKSMESALKESLLRLSRQRIQFGNSQSSSRQTSRAVGRVAAKTATTIRASENTAKVKRVERSAPHKSIKKKRGRPQTISDEKKNAALQLKASGGTNKQAAELIYGKRYPTPQQVKNVSAILRHHKLKSKQSGSPAKGRKVSLTPHRKRG